MEPLKLELEGIDDRRVRLTIHSSDLLGAVLSKDGEKLFYIASFEKGYDLWVTELRTKETKVAAKLGADNAGYLMMDKEGKNLFFLEGRGIQRRDGEGRGEAAWASMARCAERARPNVPTSSSTYGARW